MRGTDSLDALGMRTIRVPTRVGQFTRPAMLTLSAAVIDANNQMVSTTLRTPVHASSLYVAAKGQQRGLVLEDRCSSDH